MLYSYITKKDTPLITDLYELTMAQVYFNEKRDDRAVFNFYIRHTPNRGYFVSAGLEELTAALFDFRFDSEAIKYLDSLGIFSEEFLKYLQNFRFSGNLWAIEEGEIIFENEPVVQVEAPLIEAQVIETLVINTMQYSILSATKALRCVSVAKETRIVDFGFRRSHMAQAGVTAARSGYMCGFLGSSNLAAGRRFGVPVFGTMAHSFVLAHRSEEEAFEAFARAYPNNAIFLIDTYDTISGLKKAIEVAKRVGIKLKGVRLDSGDVLNLSKKCREILDQEGFKDTMVLVSGGVDEYMIEDLLKKKAPIDAWGVGTKFVVSEDLPSLDCAYKLVELNGEPKMKFSSKKVNIPAKKQIFRQYRDGVIYKDTLGLFDEELEGEPMLKEVIREGECVYDFPFLDFIRKRLGENFEKIPDNLKELNPKSHFRPNISKKLSEILAELEKMYKKNI